MGLQSGGVVARSLLDKARIEKGLGAAEARLALIAEAYPDLQADENFRQLSENLGEVEDHIQYARRYYNGTVRIFNTHIQSFPHKLIAKPFNFQPAEYFEVEDNAQRSSPAVELD